MLTKINGADSLHWFVAFWIIVVSNSREETPTKVSKSLDQPTSKCSQLPIKVGLHCLVYTTTILWRPLSFSLLFISTLYGPTSSTIDHFSFEKKSSWLTLINLLQITLLEILAEVWNLLAFEILCVVLIFSIVCCRRIKSRFKIGIFRRWGDSDYKDV